MDTINAVVQIISMTGFPIFACLALGWYVKNVMDKLETTIQDMRIVIEKNTLVIDELVAHLDDKKGGKV